MVKICSACSYVDLDKVIEIVGEENVYDGCIGRCGIPYVAIIDYNAVICDSEEELLEEIRKRTSQ